MKHLGLIAVFTIALVGCGSDKLETTNNPETPKPTQEQLDKMPPQAAEHAKQMSDYAKAQAESQKGRMGGR